MKSFVEGMGGEVLDVEVSRQAAQPRQAARRDPAAGRILELKANPDRTAEGVVIEASSIVAAVRLPPFWFSAARSSPATFSSPAPSGAVCAP
jgi:hypothetical protein